MNSEAYPAPALCPDCGAPMSGRHEGHSKGPDRCPACFDQHLLSLDAGFLESFRRHGARSRLVLAETCLRGLILDTPERRKILAATIFEQYVLAISDLAAIFLAFRERETEPILKSFADFRLDAEAALEFFQSIQSADDIELCRQLDLPLPSQVAQACPHLGTEEANSVAIAVHQLMGDLRKATDNSSALALAQFTGHNGSVVPAVDARWLEEAKGLTPDQVAMLVLDSRSGRLLVHGLTADEKSLGTVVDAIETVSRASSNLVFAYLQAHDL